nr:RHS repeat-associated core domain-containing protein [Fimbriimonadaceae bacterium]
DKGRVGIATPSGSVSVDRGSHGLGLRSTDLLGETAASGYDTFLNANSGSRAGRSWLSTSDERNNVLEARDPANMVRGASYTSQLNRLDWFRDARNQLLDFDYDLQGNVTKITYPDGTFEAYTYELGEVKTHRNRRGQTKTYTYNLRGLLTSVVAPDETLTYGYDLRGNQTSANSSITGLITMEYNSRDYMIRIDYPGDQWFEYAYDAVGRRTSSTSSLGTTMIYAYDSVGRIWSITANGAALIAYTYDSAGRLASESRGNGTSTTYSYDVASRVTSVKHYAPGGALQAQYLYSNYDAFGNPRQMTTPAGSWNFTFDSTSQLTSIITPGGVSSNATYDPEGNRLSTVDGGVTTPYSVNNLNQYTAAGNETFTYDPDGNVLTRTIGGQVTGYSWNSSGQLIGISMPNGDVYAFQYDALGRRFKSLKNGVATRFVFDGSSLAGELDGNGVMQVRYLHGSGLVARQDAGAVGYYGFDATGHTRLITGSNGSVLNTYEYSPFGSIASMTETLPNRFRYVGKFGVSDDGAGLYHMGARYYDPVRGRFVSTDPVGLEGGDPSFYRYCGNQPVLRADPSGHFWWWVAVAVANGAVNVGVNGAANAIEGKDFFKDWEWAFAEGSAIGLATSGFAALGHVKKIDTFRKMSRYKNSKIKIGDGSLDMAMKWRSRLDDALISAREFGDDYFNRMFADLTLRNLGIDVINELNQRTIMDSFAENSARERLDGEDTEVINSWDPNEKNGPIGAGTEGWIAPDGTMTYTIRFENLPTATAAAYQVVVTDTLNPNLDISTMSLEDILVGQQTLGNLSGFQEGHFRVPLNGSNLLLDVTVAFDLATRKITWTLKAIDPLTGELPELDGFLPPNDQTGRGEGYVRFTIMPKAATPNGTVITNQGHIKFDLNPIIETNIWSNRIGTAVIDSKVQPLPATSPYIFPVTWTGTVTGGPSIASYDIFVSKDAEPYTLWKDNTTQTVAEFVGEGGRTYRFYSVATTTDGQVEQAPFGPDAQTTTSLMASSVESFVIVDGETLGGGLNELLISDNLYLSVLSNESTNSVVVEVSGRFYGQYAGLSRLRTQVELACSRPGTTQTVMLFNWQSNTWVSLDNRLGTDADQTLTLITNLSKGRFVNAQGQVKARVRWQPINDEEPTQDGWSGRLDRVRWELLPLRGG